MLVRVLTDNGGSKPVPMLARVMDERDDGYTIVYLSSTEDKDRGRTIYRYEEDPYDIDDDYVIEYLDDEEEAGFVPSQDGGWIKRRIDDDDDYEPSDEDGADEGSDEESLDEEDEEFEQEEDAGYDDDYDDE